MLPAGKQVQMSKVSSSTKLQSGKDGISPPPFSSVSGWSVFTFSDQTFKEFSSICASVPFNNKKQLTPFLE